MAADPRLQSIPYWESRQPFVIATEQASWDDQDPRYQRCAQEWAMSEQLLPLLKAMHEMSPDHVHEELELENLDFSSYNLDWMARVPAWRDFYLSQNQAPHYLYMKQVLKAVQHCRIHQGFGEAAHNRWVLKCPQHLEQLPVLADTFPKATLVITHRDPVDVIASIVTMEAPV